MQGGTGLGTENRRRYKSTLYNENISEAQAVLGLLSKGRAVMAPCRSSQKQMPSQSKYGYVDGVVFAHHRQAG